MTCQNPDCAQEIDHEQEARLRTSTAFIEVIIDCPSCGLQHFTSFRPAEMCVQVMADENEE